MVDRRFGGPHALQAGEANVTPSNNQMRFRFSLRTLFALFVVVAALAYCIRKSSEMRAARESFEYVHAMHEVGRVSIADEHTAARELYKVERTVPWRSSKRARADYIKRLESLIAFV